MGNVTQVEEPAASGEKNPGYTRTYVISDPQDHELFLYFQSWYNTPRWSLYMEQAAPIPLAKIFVNGRRKEYNPERTQRQIDHAKKY